MASVTVNATNVDHTLPTYFAGLGFGNFRAQNDFPQTAYRNALSSMNPEILRLNPFHSPGTVASPNANYTAMKNLCLFFGSRVGVWMGTTGAHPNGQPSTSSEVSPTNYEGVGSGRSPSEMADWFENFHNAGINVLGMEFYNEPDNCASGTGGNGPGDGPWFGPGGNNPSQSDINKCETWVATVQRQYRAAVAAKGITMPKIGGHVLSTAQAYGQEWAKKFANGHGLGTVSGATWPYSDSNWDGYYDVHTFHPYQKGSTNQGLVNSIFYDPQPRIDSGSLATKSFLHNMRSYFDANGKTIKLSYNEYGNGAGNAFSGLIEVAQAILGFGWQKQYGIDYFTSWSGNASTDPNDFPICDPSTYTLNTRACANRDLVFYFSRNYKKITGFGQAGGNTPSSGDAGGNNNAVPRLPWVSGLNAAGNKLSVLVCNLDLSNSEAFTFTWSNANASGAATYRQLLPSTTVTGTTPLPSGSQTLSGQSFTRTLEAGSSYLFEIPVAVSGGGGSPTYTYQWERGNAPLPGTGWTNIAGATAATYTLTSADSGHLIRCQATSGSNFGYSAPVGPIT